MSQLFIFRSQAVELMQRQGHNNFRTATHEDSGMWKGWYEQGESPAEGWQKKDYVNHVEMAWVDKARVGVIVVTCRKHEIPQEDLETIKQAGFIIEPLTPSLWSRDDVVPTSKTKRPASTGVRAKSDVESPTRLVWSIADSMPGASRKDIIAACVEKGVHPSTASTQYSKWNRARQ